MKRIIVTGCYGFIGKKLTRVLLENGYCVLGVDIYNGKEFDSFCNFEFKNFNDFLDIKGIESNSYKESTLYHMAWIGVSTTDKNDPNKQLKNIELTYSVLVAAKNIMVKRIIIPGSMSEFSGSNIAVDGYGLDSPADLYAATKVAIRKIAYQFCKANSINLNWLLVTSIYSVDRMDANLITYVIKNLLHNEIVETTKLEQQWDYLCVEDLVRAMILVGDYGIENKIYPIGSGEVRQLSYYVELIAKYLKRENLLKIGAIPYKNAYIDNSIPDIAAIQKDCGFKPLYNFEDEIVVMIEKYKEKIMNIEK